MLQKQSILQSERSWRRKERSKAEDDLAKASFDLTEDLEMVLLIDEKAEQSSAYRTYQED